MLNFWVCKCKSQDFAQIQKNVERSHDRESVTFRNSGILVFFLPWWAKLNFWKLFPFIQRFCGVSSKGKTSEWREGVEWGSSSVYICSSVSPNLFSQQKTPPCILQENLCSTFWQQESPAARSLGLLMSRPAKSPGRSCPTPSNRDKMNWEREISLSICPSGAGSSFW